MKKKTIFTIMTLGLVTLLGFGFLGGLNYQPKEAKASEITTHTNKKCAKINPTLQNPLQYDKTYYFVAKNYQQNGLNYFYQNSITLENSLAVNNSYTTASADFTLILNDNRTRNTIYFTTLQSAGQYHLDVVALYQVLEGGSSGNYSTIYNASDGIFNRLFCSFICTQINVNSNHAINFYYYIENLFDVYDLGNWVVSYDFDNYFNYNNFAQRPNQNYLNRALFPISGMISSTGADNTFTIDLPFFKSGDLVFNQIKVVFGLDLGYTFENSSGEWVNYSQPVVDNYNTYFASMSYVNNVNNFEVLVCNRVAYSTGTGYSATHIFYKPTWTSIQYKYIQLQSDITNIKIKNILSGVVVEDINAIVTNPNGSLGLGNAFALVSQAFTAWLPILGISVIPGITLGMLIFLPLIAGIIIFIIWIVKR